MVVSDGIEFLRSRGHPVDDYTDYELRDEFEKAWKNEQHDRIEIEYAVGKYQVSGETLQELAANRRKYDQWRADAHAAIETGEKPVKKTAQYVTQMYRQFGVPVEPLLN